MKLTRLHFEILQVLSCSHISMYGLEDQCEHWTNPRQLRQSVAELVDLGTVTTINTDAGTRYALRGFPGMPQQHRVARVRSDLLGPTNRAHPRCGQVGVITQVGRETLTLRFGPRVGQQAVLGVAEVVPA